MEKILFKEEGFAIRGAIIKVYKTLGAGFPENIYQEALEMEFEERNIPFIAQPSLPIAYNGKVLKHNFRPDFLCYDNIIVEIKSVQQIAKEHEAQVLNYLKASKLPMGYLVNFSSAPEVYIKGFVKTLV